MFFAVPGFFLGLDLLVVSHAILLVVNRELFNIQCKNMRNFHDPVKAGFLYDNAQSKKALKFSSYSIPISHLFGGVPFLFFNILVPLCQFLITHNGSDLLSLPYCIPGFSGASYADILINMLHQICSALLRYFYSVFLTSLSINYFIHLIQYTDILLSYLDETNYEEPMTREDFIQWQGILVDGTCQLTQ